MTTGYTPSTDNVPNKDPMPSAPPPVPAQPKQKRGSPPPKHSRKIKPGR